MRVFKTKWFVRFARQEGLTDAMLCDAVARAANGLIDADLGGDVIKQRIARPNEGRSGGYRTVMLYRTNDKAFFVFGFPKSARENLRRDELRGFKELAKNMFGLDSVALRKALKTGAIVEVKFDEQDVSK